MKVSVIIPCYNYGRFLSRAIRSLINQTLDKNEYEIIVIDDGSNDETREIMNTFSEFIKPIFLNKNCGVAAARNIGIKAALGRYFVNVDADDYVDRAILNMLSAFLDHNPNFVGVSCDYFYINENEEHVSRQNGEKKPIACGVMFRKEKIVEVGLYDPNFLAREEEDLKIRLGNKGYQIYNLIIPLYRYRLHNNNLTKNNVLMDDGISKIGQKHTSKKPQC